MATTLIAQAERKNLIALNTKTMIIINIIIMSSPSPQAAKATQALLAVILLLSGFCSLVYQTVWLREFRLVFGGAAPAASAVVAIFMAGLGFGGRYFGSWVERVGRPFRFYARLEVGIALAAMASPALLSLVRSLYLKTGGTAGMGLGAATVMQLLMTAIVLGTPCFLMGGTLPAAMKFAQRDDDPRRSITAFFYGINIAGAVSGAALSTFWLLPTLGNRGTLSTAVVVNIAIALVAGLISMLQERDARQAEEASPVSNNEVLAAKAPSEFVLAAAFLSGFTFFVIEMVWYRISTPLIGGSVYGFGLVLCVVLAGMGLGGLLYSLILKKAEPTVSGFTIVSALQALAVLVPYALGDRVAHLALILDSSLRGLGLAELAAGWAVIMGILAFLPSLLSGMQFPMLVALLGRGNAGVGQQLGRAYLWNTFGSISGSLLGSFILVPALGLKNGWLFVAILIAMMSAASLLLQVRETQSAVSVFRRSKTALGALAACLIFALFATGPTATWQHTPIGYGRLKGQTETAITWERFHRDSQRNVVRAYDGRETSVAVIANGEYGFLTNGKSDGSAVFDAGTQVMLGIIGAILHPNPQNACVVGLGTGTTAGWLADVPGMNRVDVLELENEIRKVAECFNPVSRNAMNHPRVNNITGDAREFLLTKGENYDIIVSEPSNPCRAGVANLYTREFYENARQRLKQEGIFCQWLQAYEVEPDTITTVITTLRSVFPKVEVWSTENVDLLLVCSQEDKPWNLDSIRQRIQLGSMKEALTRFWLTDTAEGFLAGCLSNSDYCTALANEGKCPLNTDNMNHLEFSFARSVAKKSNRSLELTKAATRAGCQLPKIDKPIEMPLYLAERCHASARLWKSSSLEVMPADIPEAVRARMVSLNLYWKKKDYAGFLKAPQPDVTTFADKFIRAHAQSRIGSPVTPEDLSAVRSVSEADAEFFQAVSAHAQKQPSRFIAHSLAGLEQLQKSPWCHPDLVSEALQIIVIEAKQKSYSSDPGFLPLFKKLGEEYPVAIVCDSRSRARCEMALTLDPRQMLSAVESMGRPYPWEARALVLRATAYLRSSHSDLDHAIEEMNLFVAQGGKLGGELEPFTAVVKTSSTAMKTTAPPSAEP